MITLVAQDAEFAVLMKQKMFAHRIRIQKATTDNDTASKGYYRTVFNADGELEIHYVKTWTNLSDLGNDLCTSISVGEAVPYTIAKSIRMKRAMLDAQLQSFEQLLQITVSLFSFLFSFCFLQKLYSKSNLTNYYYY